MKKALAILLIMMVFATTAVFAKSNLLLGAGVGLDVNLWKNELRKTVELDLPISVGATCFLKDNFGLYLEGGINIGLAARDYELEMDVKNSNTYFAGLGATVKLKMNQKISLLASLGAQVYFARENFILALANIYTFEASCKTQAMFEIADGVQLLAGAKASVGVAQYHKGDIYEGWADDYIGFSVVPNLSLCVEL